MKVVRAVCGLLAATFVAAAMAVAQGTSPEIVRVISLPGRPLPVVMGQKQGIFAKHGITVHAEAAPNSDVLRTSLAQGKAEVAHAAVDNAVAMVETGAAEVAIVMGGETTLNELIVQPGIKSISELRGKTVIVDAPDTAYALQLKQMLLVKGLKAGADYTLKPVGGTPLRLKAMRENKEYAASILGPPYSIVAKEAGLVSLGPAEKVVGVSQSAGAYVRRDWAREHRDTLVRYLAAYVEAQRWLLAPANKPQVVELIASELSVPATVAAETYTQMMESRGGFQPDAKFDVKAFQNVLKLRAEVEGQWGGKPPTAEKYYDLTYYRESLSKLKQQK